MDHIFGKRDMGADYELYQFMYYEIPAEINHKYPNGDKLSDTYSLRDDNSSSKLLPEKTASPSTDTQKLALQSILCDNPSVCGLGLEGLSPKFGSMLNTAL